MTKAYYSDIPSFAAGGGLDALYRCDEIRERERCQNVPTCRLYRIRSCLIPGTLIDRDECGFNEFFLIRLLTKKRERGWWSGLSLCVQDYRQKAV